jgi:hypothetical protein
MLRFLLWNLNGKPLENTVANLVRRHDIDVLILVECKTPVGKMLQVLNSGCKTLFRLPFSPDRGRQTVVYTRFSEKFTKPVYEEGDRLVIWRLTLPLREDILLAAAHFPSKMYQSNESQAQGCCEFANTIRQMESEHGIDRTVVVGDLNMNPFEAGMVSALGFNATSTRRVAERKNRTINCREYPFFYNPMWQYLGDRKAGPPGTYYYGNAEHVCYFWNVFDQVLIRPSLLDRFRNEELEILTHDGVDSLLSDNGQPNHRIASDHLPIVFALDLEHGERHVGVSVTNQS